LLGSSQSLDDDDERRRAAAGAAGGVPRADGRRAAPPRALPASRRRSAVAMFFAAARRSRARRGLSDRDARPESRADLRDPHHRAGGRTRRAGRARRRSGAPPGLADVVLSQTHALDRPLGPPAGGVLMGGPARA